MYIILVKVKNLLSGNKKGMEMVQVAILVAIAIILGLIFKSEIVDFVNKTLNNLNKGF
ncbi:MAG: Flp1 family type IVb pilin [Anaerovoracaceae bacterium]